MNEIINENELYVVNPAYRLKNDNNKRVLLLNREVNQLPDPGISDFFAYTHPIFAALLSLFDGNRTIRNVIDEFIEWSGLTNDSIVDFLCPMLENKEKFKYCYEGHPFYFPQNILIKKETVDYFEIYDYNNFLIPKKNLDLSSWRVDSPIDLIYEINFKCKTNCIYCYADRDNKHISFLSLERIKDLISEARSIGMRSFDISGGELFLHDNWEEIMKALIENGFSPYISTKVPIPKRTIEKLQNMGQKMLQISLDSINPDEIEKMWGNNGDYLENIKQTINEINKTDMDLYINCQITRFNQNSIFALIDYLLGLPRIKKIGLGAAGYSIYNNNYLNYRADLEEIKRIEEKVENYYKERALDSGVFINFGGFLVKNKYLSEKREEKKANFLDRTRCSANFYALVVLPDGKVTVCEELYWHPKFIIGDLSVNSILEVWNSDKALNLYKISKNDIRKESICSECDDFDPCHQQRGVCWKEVLYAYGYDNWDYPDPKCHLSPKPFNTFYLEQK